MIPSLCARLYSEAFDVFSVLMLSASVRLVSFDRQFSRHFLVWQVSNIHMHTNTSLTHKQALDLRHTHTHTHTLAVHTIRQNYLMRSHIRSLS